MLPPSSCTALARWLSPLACPLAQRQSSWLQQLSSRANGPACARPHRARPPLAQVAPTVLSYVHTGTPAALTARAARAPPLPHERVHRHNTSFPGLAPSTRCPPQLHPARASAPPLLQTRVDQHVTSPPGTYCPCSFILRAHRHLSHALGARNCRSITFSSVCPPTLHCPCARYSSSSILAAHIH